MINFYKSLKPLHLFLFGTIFMLLARTANGNFAFEISCLFTSLILYILALVKYLKK
jgi:hypothetical protein